MKRFFSSGWRIGIPALVVVLVSCYTVPETHRSSFNIISPGNETRLGISAFDEIKRQEHESTNKEQIELVQRVGQRIAKVAEKDIPNAKWEFVLFENNEPNAFALPGGKVGVYTGILPITKTDAGLAAVLGHEIAHVSARHGAERMSEQMALSGIAAGLAIGLSGKDPRIQQISMIAFGLGTTVGAVLPHNRMQESEADHIGLLYMAKAGYNPNDAVSFWERFRDFNRQRGKNPPAFLSTHPTDDKRIKDLKALVPEAEVYYKTSGR